MLFDRMVGEVRSLSRLGWPIMITQLSQMGMGLIDAVMAGHAGAADLAGVAVGNSLYWPVLLLFSGILLAEIPTVAQLRGAGRVSEIGAVVRQAGWVAVICSLCCVMLLFGVEPLLHQFQVDPEAIPIAVNMLKAQSLGISALLGYYVLRYFCDGMSWTKPAMVIALSALVVKAPLTYVLVFGVSSEFSGFGGVGCGIATAILAWYQFSIMLVVVGTSRLRRTGVFKSFDFPRWDDIFNLVRVGMPIGIGLFFEVGFFSMVALFIGRLGTDAIASHAIAMNVGGLGFMIPLALGMATTIRVGTNIGARRMSEARLSAIVSILLALCIGSFIAMILLIAGDQIVSLYTRESAVAKTAAQLLVLCALFQLFDATQVAAIGALRGYKDTRIPMFIALFSYWLLGIPVGYIMCYGYGTFSGIGILGFWWGMVAGLGVAAVILNIRLLGIKHGHEQVAKVPGLPDA